ncbi:MAG: hypothetical protein U1F24_10430 [Alphaproteobacteria bacterium]
MTFTLIHSPQSRSTGIIWLLEELGAAYDIRRVTIRRAGSEEGLDFAIRIRTARCLPCCMTAR